MSFKNIILLIFLSIFTSCLNRKQLIAPIYRNIDFYKMDSIPVPISESIKKLSYYWKLDSLGLNGVRWRSHMYITKAYNDGVNYNFVKQYLGPGDLKYENEDEYRIRIRYVFMNSDKMDGDWLNYKQIGYVRFTFDKRTKQLLDVYTTSFGLD